MRGGRQPGAGRPRGSVRRLSPKATRDAVLALLPDSDRLGASTVPRWGAWERLAVTIGVPGSAIRRAVRNGATVETIGRWRALKKY